MQDAAASPSRFPFSSPAIWFLITVLLIALASLFGPAEATLGASVRLVYLHGVWVWASLISFFAAAGAGLLGLAMRRVAWQRWSRALGRTGLFFWITYIPLSVWAAQANWNGLFLAEPRWRVAFTFALGGLLLQLGLALVARPAWAAALNVVYLVALILALRAAEQVMHPPSPIFSSGSFSIQSFFIVLLLLALLAAWHMARWWYGRDHAFSTDAHT